MALQQQHYVSVLILNRILKLSVHMHTYIFYQTYKLYAASFNSTEIIEPLTVQSCLISPEKAVFPFLPLLLASAVYYIYRSLRDLNTLIFFLSMGKCTLQILVR